MIIGFVVLFPTGGLLQQPVDGATGLGKVAIAVVATAVIITLYWAVMRFVARRRITELPLSRAVPQTSTGVLLGLGIIAIPLIILVSSGAYALHATGRSWWPVIWPILTYFAFVTVFEELLFRGIVFQALERIGGSWVALAVSAVAFGLIHLIERIPLWQALIIAVTGGLLLGAAFLYTRSLWLPIGIHFAWNSTEDVFGLSGTPGLYDGTPDGPSWLAGAPRFFEGSLVTVLTIVAISALLLLGARKRGHIKPHPRRR